MTAVVLIPVYLTALIVGSVVLHRRYSCFAAAILTGFISAFLATSVFVAVEERSSDPNEYIGAFWWGGISLWIVSSILSGFIGLPFQRKKKRSEEEPNRL